MFVRLFVSSLLTFRYFSIIVSLFGAGAAPFFSGSGSGSSSEQTVSAAPAPAPTKMCRLRRLRLRLRIPDYNTWLRRTHAIYGQIPDLRQHVVKTHNLVNEWRIWDVTVSYDILAWSSLWSGSIAQAFMSQFHM